jgi:apolipoprotein N-acyltransferase
MSFLKGDTLRSPLGILISTTFLSLLINFIPDPHFVPVVFRKVSFNPSDLLYLAPLIWYFFKTPFRKALWHSLIIHLVSNTLYYIIADALSLVSVLLILLTSLILSSWSFFPWAYAHSKDPKSLKAFGLSAVSWAGYALCTPPFQLGPLIFVIMIPWMYVAITENSSRVRFASFFSGFIYHSIMYYWIYNVVKVGPPLVIILGLILLISTFSLYTVLLGWILNRLRSRGLWLFPVFWVAVEVLRTRGDISFPWGHIGYSLGHHQEMLQALAYIGIFGYSFLIIMANLCAVQGFLTRRYYLIAIPFLIPLLLFIQGFSVLANQQFSTQSANIALVQPSVEQGRKWEKDFFEQVMARTWSMLDTLDYNDLDLVVLAETAVPDFLRLHPREQAEFRRRAREMGASILVGALNYDRKGVAARRGINYYNSAFLFEPKGPSSEYRKIRLVPFSERIPWEDVFPLLNYVDLGEGDFTPGTEVVVFDDQLSYAPNICYESIYPSFVRRNINAGAKLIVNITNDAWFGRSTAPYQHANLIKYRSIENAIPIARCANSGVSVFYDEYGNEYGKTELFEKVITRHNLPLKHRSTLYSQIGEVVEWLFLILGVLVLIWVLALKIGLNTKR